MADKPIVTDTTPQPVEQPTEQPESLTPERSAKMMGGVLSRLQSSMADLQNAASGIETAGQMTPQLEQLKHLTAYTGAEKQLAKMQEVAASGGVDTVTDWLRQLPTDQVYNSSESSMPSPLDHPALVQDARDKLGAYETKFITQLENIGAEDLPVKGGGKLDIFALDVQEAYKEAQHLGRPLFDVMFGQVEWSRASALDKLSVGFNTHLLELQLQGEHVDQERANKEMEKYFPELNYLRTSNNQQYLKLLATKTSDQVKQFWNDANFSNLSRDFAETTHNPMAVLPEQKPYVTPGINVGFGPMGKFYVDDLRMEFQKTAALAGEVAVSSLPYIGAGYLMYSAAEGEAPVTELVTGEKVKIHGWWRVADIVAALIPAYHGFKTASKAYKAIQREGGILPAISEQINNNRLLYGANRERLKAALKAAPESEISRHMGILESQAETSLSARQLLRLYKDAKADPRNARAIMLESAPSESQVSRIARWAVNDQQARQELANLALAALKNDAKGEAARKALKAESPDFIEHLIHDVRAWRGEGTPWATRGEQQLKALQDSLREETNLVKAVQQRNASGRVMQFDAYDAMLHDKATINPLTGEPVRLALPAPNPRERFTTGTIELGAPENYIGDIKVPVAEGDTIQHAGGEVVVHMVDNENNLITLMDSEGRHYTMTHSRFNATNGDPLIYEPEEIRKLAVMQGAPPATKILNWTKTSAGHYVHGETEILRRGKKWVVLEGGTETGQFGSLLNAQKALQKRVDEGLAAAREAYLTQQANIAVLREQNALKEAAIELARKTNTMDKIASDSVTPVEESLTPKRPGPKTTKAQDIAAAKKRGKSLARKAAKQTKPVVEQVESQAGAVETSVQGVAEKAAPEVGPKRKIVKTETQVKLDPEGEAAVGAIMKDTTRIRSLATYLGETGRLKPKEKGMLFAVAKRLDAGEELSAAQKSYAHDILAKNMEEVGSMPVGTTTLKKSLAAESMQVDVSTLKDEYRQFIIGKVNELGPEAALKKYNDLTSTTDVYARQYIEQKWGSQGAAVANNASGESAASIEAIKVAKSRKRQGIKMMIEDTRSGKRRPAIGPRPEDNTLNPHEALVQIKDGKETIINKGAKVTRLKNQKGSAKAGAVVGSALLAMTLLAGMNPADQRTTIKQMTQDQVEKALAVPVQNEEQMAVQNQLWDKRIAQSKPTTAWKQATEYDDAFARAETTYGLPAGLLKRMAWQESRFNPKAKSPAGATGLMQFMPTTWAELGNGADINDPMAQIDAAARYMVRLHDRFGSWARALAAYNGGPTNLTNRGAIENMKPETIQYVADIGADVKLD